MPEPNLQKLYGFITGTKFDAGKLDIGDYDTFRLKMQQADSRQKLYDFLSRQTIERKRADFGTFEEFDSKVKLVPYSEPAVPEGFKIPKPKLPISEVVLGRERQARGLEKPSEEPIVPITKMTGVEKVDAQSIPGPYKYLFAVGRPALKAAESLTTPENLILLNVMSSAPKWLQSLGSAGFAYLMGRELPEQWSAFKEAKTPTEKTEAAASALLNVGMTAAAAKHAVKGGIGAAKEVKIGRERARVLPELERAAETAKEVTRVAEVPRIAGREELAKAGATAEEITGAREAGRAAERAKEVAKKIEEEKIANLETPELQLQSIAEVLATDKFKKPFEQLTAAEKNSAKEQASRRYKSRLQKISDELEVTDENLAGAKNRKAREQQAREILRGRLVEEKAARAPKIEEPAPAIAPAEEVPIPARPEIEPRVQTERRALQEDWETKGVQKGDFLYEATPKDVYEQTTGGTWSDKIAEEFKEWRKTKGTEFELGDAEVFAGERRAQVVKEKPRVAKLETPDEIGLAQQRRLEQLESIGASEDTIARDPVLKALNSRDRDIQAEALEKFKEMKDETAFDLGEIERSFAKTFGEPEPTVSPETVPSAPRKTPKEIETERKAKIVQDRLELQERKLEFAKKQQAEKERLVQERRTEQEQKRREALQKKLGERFGEKKVTLAKEKKKPKVEEAPITAETPPITGKEPKEGRPLQEKAITEVAEAPVMARPFEKQPWEMTQEEFIKELESRPEPETKLFIQTAQGRIETTFERALKDKQITKKQFDENIYGGLSRKQHFKMRGQALHLTKVQEALRKGESVPEKVLAEYPGLKEKQSEQPPTGKIAPTKAIEASKYKPPVAPVERKASPEIARLRPSEQHRRAKAIADKIDQSKSDWQDRLKNRLEKEGFPNNIIKFFAEQTRKARPSEPFGPHTATTREGRVERAISPPPELEPKVNAVADIGRKNQIAQARLKAAQKELATTIEKEGKGGVQVKIDPKGNYEITVTDPSKLTKSTEDKIQQLKKQTVMEGERGIAQLPILSTDFAIHVTPSADVLKGTEMPKGSFADMIVEAIRRKKEAAQTQKAFDKLKSVYKDDLVDYYFENENRAMFTGKTKEGLPVTVQVQRGPSGRTLLAESVREQIAKLEKVDRTQTETGSKILETTKSRGEWEDKMVAQFGTEIKPRLNDIWDTIDYIKNNKLANIRDLGKKVISEETTKGKGFEFIRANLSEADQAKFDATLDKIKSTDVELLSKANDFGTVLAGTVRQYANYAEFGYWTLKSLGKAGLNKAAWTAKMIEGLGEKIKPFLDDLWNKINVETYRPGQEFTETDLPKFNLNASKPKVKDIETSLPDDPTIETPRTKVEREAAPEKSVSAPKTPISYFMEPVVKIVERANPKAAAGFRQAIDYWENKEGKGYSIIKPLAKKLRFKPSALNRMDEISRKDGKMMWDNWHEWRNNPNLVPSDLTPIEKEAISTYDRLLDERKKVLIEAGREKVEDIVFKRVPSTHLLDAIRSEGGEVYNTLVKELARANDMPIEKVQSALRRYRFDVFEKFPTHLEVGTGGIFGKDIVPIQATQGLSTLRALNRDTARLAGVTKRFGNEYSKSLREIRKDIPPELQSAFDLARDSYFGVRRIEDQRAIWKRLLFSAAQPIIRTALLARSTTQQPSQLAATARFTGGKAFFKGLADLAKKGTQAELEAIGAYAPGILDLAWQKGQRIEDFGRIMSELGSNISLLKPAIELTDLGITSAFRRFALNIKERGGKLKANEKNTLELLDFTPEQIKLIDNRGLEGYKDADVLYSSIISRGRKAVTFTGKKGPEMTRFQLNPFISSLVQFQGYNIGQMQQAAGVVNNLKNRFEAISKAKTPDEKTAAQTQFRAAAKGAAALFVVTLGAAEANLFNKALINGQDTDRPEDFKRLLEDLAETGWMPFLREMSYGLATEPGKLTLPGSITNEIADAWIGRGKYRDREGYERAAMLLDRYATKPYTQGMETLKNVLIARGLLEGNPTLKTATSNYWDFLRKEGAFHASDQEGFDEVRAAMRGVIDAVKAGDEGELSEKTRERINENLNKALGLKTKKLIEQGMNVFEAQKEAKNRIRSSLLARTAFEKYFSEKDSAWKINGKLYNREDLARGLRDERFLDVLQTYDGLIMGLADSL